MATTKDTHTANGSQDIFGFTFPYIKQSDVKVNVDNVIVSTDDYSFSDATHVQFNTAPADGKSIDIYRSTSDSNLVATFYPGSAIRSADLNDNFTQNLYTTQETTNDANDALDNSRVLESGSYVSAITKATNAVATANAADAIADDAADDVKRWIKDGDGTDTAGNEDDADFTQRPLKPQGVPYAVAQAVAAVSTANDAETTANAADTIADGAKATADDAADDVKRWIKDGDGTDTAGDEDDADFTQRPLKPQGVPYAVAQATSAVSTANDADANATTALNNSKNSEGTSAISIAEAAEVTALAAQTAVSNSTTYNLKNNKTAFEAVTFTAEVDGQPSHKAWEITDSTGITSSYTSFTDNAGSGTAKTVTGVPSGFTGDSGLSARFNYTHSTNTFAWAGYWVNDAEDRYGGSITQNLREITTNFTLKDTMNGFSIGPVIINSSATITIPENSKYVVMN